jgi:hypothetical protein
LSLYRSKYPFLVHALALRVQAPHFYGSAPQIAEYFHIKKDDDIRKALDVLEEDGFMELVSSEPGQSKKYRALTHSEWAAKHPGRCCEKREFAQRTLPQEGGGPLPPNGVDTLPFFETNPPPKEGSKSPKEVSEKVSEKVAESSSGGESSLAASIALTFSEHEERPVAAKDGKLVRTWVHQIWQPTNGDTNPLRIHKMDGTKLERLINQHGENKVARAWYLYVNAEPRPYHTEPVEVVVKRTTRDGREYLDKAEDGSTVTNFPLAAFLSNPDGYLFSALHINKWNSENFQKVAAVND